MFFIMIKCKVFHFVLKTQQRYFTANVFGAQLLLKNPVTELP